MSHVEIFFLFLEKLSPLFLLLLLGFIAARWLKVTRESISKLLIYVISPIVFFDILIRAPFNAKYFLLPFLYAALCSLVAILTFYFSKKNFRAPMRNLLSYAGGSANTGYFGIPATAILLGADKLPIAIFIIIGYNLYEYSTGFYLAARGNISEREAVGRLLRLPAIWTFLVSLLFSYFGWNKVPVNLEPILLSFRGCYSTLGLMMIGLGLGSIRTLKLHYKFIVSCLGIKLIVFPLVVIAAILLDRHTLGILDPVLVQIFILMSLVPMAANGVAIATELNLPTDEIALTITISTILSLFWIPIAWATWVPYIIR